ncbi:MAG: iron-containing alcohol dehydrogenase, partial [Bacillota bacterium]|nr:iron-containing alcohol dehydrogenase [Bacillota bacterium]
MKKFRFYQPTKIHFGSEGLLEVGNIVRRYGTKCLLVSTSRYGRLKPVYDKVKDYLMKGGIEFFHYDEVVPNPTTEIVDKGVEIAVKNNVDVVVGIGGGSAMDTAKIVALSSGNGKVDWNMFFTEYTDPFEDYEAPSDNVLPVICVSTTSGTGSQVTQAAVITDRIKKDKVTVFHPLCFPKECIVDPQIMMSLPNDITASTAFDAFSHAFEAYINPRASVYTEQLSIESIKIVAKYLPRVLKENSIEAREKLAWADTMAGICLSNAGASIPHPLGEIIGGVCEKIAHGQTLAIVYPEFVR